LKLNRLRPEPRLLLTVLQEERDRHRDCISFLQLELGRLERAQLPYLLRLLPGRFAGTRACLKARPARDRRYLRRGRVAFGLFLDDPDAYVYDVLTVGRPLRDDRNLFRGRILEEIELIVEVSSGSHASPP